MIDERTERTVVKRLTYVTYLGPRPHFPKSSPPPSTASPSPTPSGLRKEKNQTHMFQTHSLTKSQDLKPKCVLLRGRGRVCVCVCVVPSAFSLRCWCWSSRLTLERGPSPSSSSFCSPPLSLCSSSVKPFPRRRCTFCIWGTDAQPVNVYHHVYIHTHTHTYHVLLSDFNRNVRHVVFIFRRLRARSVLGVVSLGKKTQYALIIKYYSFWTKWAQVP